MATHGIGHSYRALVRKTFRAQTRARSASGHDTSDISTCEVRVIRYRLGFTLIELLVVIAIISILAGILFPVFATARRTAHKTRCASNLRQLVIANQMYADDFDGMYVPAASDIFNPSVYGGQWRWHGWRSSANEPFEPEKGPLWPYLARSGGIKTCPSTALLKGSSPNDFEAGDGGYGYNAVYIGGSYQKYGFSPEAAEKTAAVSDVKNPSRTVMFTDAAVAQGYPHQHATEYSFCEPPYFVDANGVTPWRSTPSIHFRHNGTALVAWCDGHVSAEKMTFTEPTNAYGGDNEQLNIGWFGPDSNELFDLR